MADVIRASVTGAPRAATVWWGPSVSTIGKLVATGNTGEMVIVQADAGGSLALRAWDGAAWVDPLTLGDSGTSGGSSVLAVQVFS